MRQYTFADKLCLHVDQIAKTLAGSARQARVSPAQDIPEADLTNPERKHSAALMRINHTGEICAQALYHGQGLVSRSEKVKQKMQHAMIEEGDHLAWCHERITQLGSHTSYLNPFWYLGSLAIGITAGIAGDKWSLGFLAETESQVVAHLQSHKNTLPAADVKSYKIVEQMQHEEAQHQNDAIEIGAAELPYPIKKIMRFLSKIMVKTAYWI